MIDNIDNEEDDGSIKQLIFAIGFVVLIFVLWAYL